MFFFILMYNFHTCELFTEHLLLKKYKINTALSVYIQLKNHQIRCEHCLALHRPSQDNALNNDPIFLGPHTMAQPFNNGNNMYGSFAAMAPVAITMYCFNAAPKLTMVTLTSLLLFVLGSA